MLSERAFDVQQVAIYLCGVRRSAGVTRNLQCCHSTERRSRALCMIHVDTLKLNLGLCGTASSLLPPSALSLQHEESRSIIRIRAGGDDDEDGLMKKVLDDSRIN